MSDYEALQIISSMSDSSTTTKGTDSTFSIIVTIVSVVAAVLIYFFFVKSKNKPAGKFMQWLKDFLSFATMWIEPILKVSYYATTISVIIYSFTFLQYGGSGIGYWLAFLILGPIIIRLVYELIMMFVMVWRNTRDIAVSVKKK